MCDFSGSVKGNCTLQHPPGHAPGDDPKSRPGHKEYVMWAKWLLANYSLNPGTICTLHKQSKKIYDRTFF